MHMETVINFMEEVARSRIIILVMWAIVMDTAFGVGRAVKDRRFNSCFGIDGAIRKISMITSIVFLAVVDMVMHINLIGFIPAEIRKYFPASIATIGVSEFFGLLYIAYEAISILKNMTLCGLPTKRIWKFAYGLLNKYTDELPDKDDIERMEELDKGSEYREGKNGCKEADK